LVLAFLGALWIFQEKERYHIHHYVEVRAAGYQTGHKALADWLCRKVAEPGDTIALMDIGIVGYRCIDQDILDVTGLTDRFIAKSPGSFLAKRYNADYVLDRRPEFIVLVFFNTHSSKTKQFKLQHWTNMESRIFHSQEFKENYLTQGEEPVSNSDALKPLERGLRAAAIFEHLHPGGLSYYLVAHEYRGAESTSESRQDTV
jgi:hypothetical protein